MEEAIYNGMAAITNQGVGGASKVDVHIGEGGFNMLDESFARDIASKLKPYFNSNNSNIADMDFGI